MSLFQHEKIYPSAAGVARRFMQASFQLHVAGWTMDQLARLSILEGAAGKAPGTWLRHKTRGFGAALEHFGSKLSAAWTSPQDQGVYDKAVATATKALRGAKGLDAMDLIQDLTVNSASSSGPDRRRLFHSVGKKIQSHSNNIGQGDISPSDWRVLNTINSWVNNAAQDELRTLRERHTVPYGTSGRPDPARSGQAGTLTQEKREALLLLALQSPGGPGMEIRRTVDHLIDQSFPPASRPIVRAFLEKISHPKYRSVAQMRRLVSGFDPAKWFTHALRHVRRELTAEMDLSPQQLGRALGGNASNVFKFMRDKVGKDPRVRSTLEDLAQKIDLLEPGVSVLAKHHEEEEDDDEREAELTEKQTPRDPHGVLQQWFEKDQNKDWGTQVRPNTQYSRGAVPLRVAKLWLLKGTNQRVTTASMVHTADYRPAFKRWVGGRKFQNPESGNENLFVSLPNEERKRIYTQWQRDRLEWAGRHKPEGVSPETRLTAENFDDLEKGDTIWMSWSPVMHHKVVKIDSTGRRKNNPILQMVQVNPETGEEGETRHMHRSTLANLMMEAHRLPGERASERAETQRQERDTARQERDTEREEQDTERHEEAVAQLPQEPSGGWPDFEDVVTLRHGEDRQHVAEVFKEIAGGDMQGVTYPAVAAKMTEAMGRDAHPRAVKSVLQALGKWAKELAKAAKEEGDVLTPQFRAFKAVGLKVNEALQGAEEKIEENTQAVLGMLRGRPPLREDLMEVRRGLGDTERDKFKEDFVGLLTHDWKPGGEGVDALRAVGREHFGEDFTNGVFQDMLNTAWGARASWRDEEGVVDIRGAMLDVRERGSPGAVVPEAESEREPPAPATPAAPSSEETPSPPSRPRPSSGWAGRLQILHGDDLQGRGSRAPSSGRPADGSVVRRGGKAFVDLSYKHTSERDAKRDAERRVRSRLPDRGEGYEIEIETDQVGDYQDDWVDVRFTITPPQESDEGEAYDAEERERMERDQEDAIDEERDRVQREREEETSSPDRGLFEGPTDEDDRTDHEEEDYRQDQKDRTREGDEWDQRQRDYWENRMELRGKPKAGVTGSTRVAPPQNLVDLAAPSSMSDELRSQMRSQMRDLTLDDAKELFGRINHAIQTPDGPWMEGLKNNGYTAEGLKSLRKALKKHLNPFVGHRYGNEVLSVANEYVLEPEDADELREFKGDKPGRGTRLTNAQIFEKFLAKAKPETRDRMQSMDLADFMVMYKAIMAEDEEDEIL